MHPGPTRFLRLVIFLIGTIVLAICIIGLPYLITMELVGDWDYLPLFLGLYIPAIPFFVALYQGLKLLDYIESNSAFSELSTRALHRIRNSAIGIAGSFCLGMPYIFFLAEQDDAPGMVLIALIIIFASVVIGAFSSLLEQLLKYAILFKSENDLTI